MAKETSDVTLANHPKGQDGEVNPNLKPHSSRVPSLALQVNNTIAAPLPLSPLTTSFSPTRASQATPATPASPTSATSPTTPFSPVSATSARSAGSAQSPISPTSPPPPLKPTRSPLRPMARSIPNGSTAVLASSPKPFPPTQPGTPAAPTANAISARGSSSRTFAPASLPHSVSSPNVSTPSTKPSRPRRPATPPPIDTSQFDNFEVAASIIDELEAAVNPANRQLPASLVRRNTDGSFLIGSDGAGIVGEVEDKRKQRRLGQHLDSTELINNRVPVDDLTDSPVSIQFDRDIDYPEIDDEDDLSAEIEEHHRSIDAMLRPTLSRNTSAVSSTSNVSNISHGSNKSLELKKRDGPLPSTPSKTTLATVATTATAATATSPARPKRISVSSTAPSTTPSTHTYASGTSTAATTASTSTSGAPMTKRQYALHELLSSERAYASDLALVREVHIPLALGQSISLPYPIAPASAGPSPSSTGIPPTPPTVSVVSSSSGSESLISIGSAVSNPHTQAQQLPMTPEDARIIFSNLEEVAAFSDSLCELLETALGSAIPNLANEDSQEDHREDHVGQLFLEIIPEMEKYYKHYIHKHPTALAHLHAMTAGTGATSTNASTNSILTSLNPSASSSSTGNGPSPALLAYLQTTSAIASQHSHAWDLPSLLIKPVQRFLKYPLLLQAILDETEEGHGDKERLKLAKMKMEESARSVNESRRRAEVVREVLMGKGSAVAGVKGVALSAGVNLGKMKSLKVGNGKRVSGSGKDAPGAASTPTLLPSSSGAKPEDPDVMGNAEAKQVEILKEELKRIESFAQTFAKNVVDWAKMMGNMIRALRVWSVAFGKVIGLTVTPFNATGSTASGGSGGSFSDAASSINGSQGDGQNSEAFDAFLTVIEAQLTPLCATLESVVNDKVLKDIARLLATMNQPLKLIASMDSQAPFHHHLLTMAIGPKSRPSPALLAASQNYLALRGQLAAELPTYLKLLHKGLGGCILKLAEVQADFWRDVKARWSDLWDMLRVEGEMNAGHEETVRVWIGRWADVEVVLAALGICRPIPPSSTPSSKRNTQEAPPKERKYSNASSHAGVGLAGAYPGAQAFVPPVPTAVSPSFAPLMPNYEPPTYAQAYAQAAMTIQATNLASSPPLSSPGPTTPPTPAAAKVMGILGNLDPAHAPPSNGISGPLPLQPRPSRPRGASDVSGKHPSASSTSVNGSSGSGGGSSIFSGKTSVGSIKRKTSMESLRSTVASVHTVKPTPSVRRNDSHTRKKSGDGGFFDFVSFGNQQQPPRGDMSRTKSMPLTVERSNSHKSSSSQEVLLQEQYEQQYQQQEVAERGRNALRKPNSLKQKLAESFRGPQQSQQSSSRQRSTSKGNATYFPDDPDAPPLPTSLSPRKNIAFQQQQQQYYARPDSWADRKGKYVCRVIHACKPPHAAFYFSYPFFTLIEGDLYEVLQEVGHPSMHPKLPLYVDDGEDCLLLCRDGYKNVGWALASFLEPIELDGW